MSGNLEVIDTKEKAAELLLALMSGLGETFGFDTETVDIDPRKQSPVGNGRVVCWSLAYDETRYFIWHDYLRMFKPFFESSNHFKVGHNIYGFDKHILGNHGIQLNGIAADTMHLSRLLYNSKERSHGLKDLARNWLSLEQPSYKSLFSRPTHSKETVKREKIGKSVRNGIPTVLGLEWCTVGSASELIPLNELARDYPQRLEALYEYASLDAYITLKLYWMFKEKLEEKSWATHL